MTITKDSVVSVTYELRLVKGNGDIFEKTTADRPLTFIMGHGNLLPKFEGYLEGLKVGDKFDFKLASADAYGEFSKEAVVDVPKNIFGAEGEVNTEVLFVGNVIPMMDQSGNRFNGKVLEIAESTVKMDFNHPLAGEDLHFKGEVAEVRAATEEELSHGHIHASGGCGGGDCGGCGCGSEEEASHGGGSCGSGCGCN
jgi:FKBP-type peptidyl-prolyl cis-trans isomerase SlyD